MAERTRRERDARAAELREHLRLAERAAERLADLCVFEADRELPGLVRALLKRAGVADPGQMVAPGGAP